MFKKIMEKAFIKSAFRGIFIAINAVGAAAHTYAASGQVLGFNRETFLGIAWTLAGVGVALAQRYFDKTDLAFGNVTALVAVQAEQVIETKISKTTKKVTTPAKK